MSFHGRRDQERSQDLFAAAKGCAIPCGTMTSYLEALNLIRDHARDFVLTSERVSLSKSIGRVVAAPVVSSWTLPAFDTSAMDGFAVRSAETAGATETNPISFKIIGGLAAGDQPSSQISSAKTAWEIMTGAPFPPGYDACVRQEDVVRSGTSLVLKNPVPASHNRRLAGEDFKSETVIVDRGHTIRAEDLLCFAALGMMELEVSRKVKVAIIATGKELVDAAQTPHGAQIRNSTTPFLIQALKLRGADVIELGQVGDDPTEFLARLERARDVDLILTTGAISVGRYDFVIEALQHLELRIAFQKVKIRPGKPLLFGRLQDGRFVMGLPGNPVATATGFRFFVDPLLRVLQGLQNESPRRCRLTHATKKGAGATSFLKACVDGDTVTALGDQKASMTSPILKSNAWIALGETIDEHVPSDTVVDVYPFL